VNNQLPAALYVVATPLGNLADLSPRAREVLASVPYVAAEDTRHSAPLLRHCNSRARCLAAHQHNEAQAAQRVVGLLARQQAVALISDAGTPAISDPGSRIVAQARAAGYPVIPIPGPCAATAALSASGIVAAPFFFCGFLPAKSGERRAKLQACANLTCTLVFYESPHRLNAMLGDCIEHLGGERRALLAREISKLFESLHHDRLEALPAWLAADPTHQKGEFVLVVEADPSGESAKQQEAREQEALRTLRPLIDEGLPIKQCANLATQITGGSKKAMYALALSLKNSRAALQQQVPEK